jgi:hypothetical protein
MKARNTARSNNEDEIEKVEHSIAAVLRDDLNYEKKKTSLCILRSSKSKLALTRKNSTSYVSILLVYTIPGF